MWRRVEERVASFAFREAYSFPFVVLVLRDERRKISKSHHNLLKISIFSFFLFLILFVCISFLFLFLFVCFFYSLNYRLGQRERVCVCVWERFVEVPRTPRCWNICSCRFSAPMSSGFRRHRPALTASRRPPMCRLGGLPAERRRLLVRCHPIVGFCRRTSTITWCPSSPSICSCRRRVPDCSRPSSLCPVSPHAGRARCSRNGDTSPDASACRSAAGLRRRCAASAAPCYDSLFRALASPGSPESDQIDVERVSNIILLLFYVRL